MQESNPRLTTRSKTRFLAGAEVTRLKSLWAIIHSLLTSAPAFSTGYQAKNDLAPDG
jgi:hypothetical protein